MFFCCSVVPKYDDTKAARFSEGFVVGDFSKSCLVGFLRQKVQIVHCFNERWVCARSKFSTRLAFALKPQGTALLADTLTICMGVFCVTFVKSRNGTCSPLLRRSKCTKKENRERCEQQQNEYRNKNSCQNAIEALFQSCAHLNCFSLSRMHFIFFMPAHSLFQFHFASLVYAIAGISLAWLKLNRFASNGIDFFLSSLALWFVDERFNYFFS